MVVLKPFNLSKVWTLYCRLEEEQLLGEMRLLCAWSETEIVGRVLAFDQIVVESRLAGMEKVAGVP
jgi:hypothetical protein